MNFLEAVDVRRSQRKYIDKQIESAIVEQLEASIKKYNAEAGLNIQLILNNDAAFKGFTRSYGLFSGVQNYLCMIGDKSDEYVKEKIGYYGQKLVLEAVGLGLGTCWVGLTYDAAHCAHKLEEDEVLICTIALGYIPEKQSFKARFIENSITNGRKSLEELYEADTDAPQWFLDGVTAVAKAPSAKNKQPIKLYWEKGVAKAAVIATGDYEHIDLGIAKLHFELGAGGGTWQFGNNEAFTKL